jgi:predicted amidophosphoribosyltransferase
VAHRRNQLQRLKENHMFINSLVRYHQLTYPLIDDVVTTGATVKYATQKLLDARASAAWIATITRRPLD